MLNSSRADTGKRLPEAVGERELVFNALIILHQGLQWLRELHTYRMVWSYPAVNHEHKHDQLKLRKNAGSFFGNYSQERHLPVQRITLILARKDQTMANGRISESRMQDSGDEILSEGG